MCGGELVEREEMKDTRTGVAFKKNKPKQNI